MHNFVSFLQLSVNARPLLFGRLASGTNTAGESPQHFMTAEHMDPRDLPVITEAYNPGVIHPFHSSRKNFTGLGHVQVSLQQKVETEKNFILTTAIVFFLLLLSLPR